MKEIELTQGKNAIVDEKNYEILKEFNWNYSCQYAVRSIYKRGAYPYRSFKVYMHHCVIGQPIKHGYEIDHINGNRLDNRSENLRIVSRRMNCQNKIKNRNGKLPGIRSSMSKKNPWRASIKIEGRTKNIGSFKTAEEAYFAYKKACEKLFQEKNPVIG